MKWSIKAKKRAEGYAFIAPGIIFIVLLLGFPLIYNFVLAFQDVNIKTFKAGTAEFVGVDNFIQLFSNEVFRKVLGNTMVFTLGCLFFQFTIGFLLALLFSKNFKLAGPLRGLILVAYMMPMSVTALLGKNMFSVDGVINNLLMKIGILSSPIEWLVSGGSAMVAVIAANCWVGIPFNMLLLTSGLTNVPTEIYESAAVDGANAWVRFWRITVPCIRSSILSVLMLGFIYTFKVFDLIFVMTAGGPMNATNVLSTYSYGLSFTEFNFSMGAASAIVLFCCLLLVGLVYLKLSMSEED